MPKDYDDSNWRREYQALKVLSERATYLLNNGAQSFSSAMWIGAMYNDWKKIKGYNKFDPKDNEGQYQSSFKEWNKSVDE